MLTAAGYESADVILGHSQGVQVALEFAAIFPDAVQAMVLLNGSHGQVRNRNFYVMWSEWCETSPNLRVIRK